MSPPSVSQLNRSSPGPWKWTYDQPFCPDIVGPDGRSVTGLRCWDDDACEDGNPERHANQQLAAAAPELLAFAQSFVRGSDAMAKEWSAGDWRRVLAFVRGLTEEARAAIAKAEGR